MVSDPPYVSYLWFKFPLLESWWNHGAHNGAKPAPQLQVLQQLQHSRHQDRHVIAVAACSDSMARRTSCYAAIVRTMVIKPIGKWWFNGINMVIIKGIIWYGGIPSGTQTWLAGKSPNWMEEGKSDMSSVQNPSLTPLNPGWFIGIPLLGYYNPNILGSIITFIIINQQRFWTLLTWIWGMGILK